MQRQHRARITWSQALTAMGLPAFEETIDPAWLEIGDVGKSDAWSLECRFDEAPSIQGNPSAAHIRFMMPSAPHERLVAGATLYLYEPTTSQLAVVAIED